jgi:hypothetical protein
VLVGVCTGSLRLECPEYFPAPISSLIRACTALSPAERPAAAQVAQQLAALQRAHAASVAAASELPPPPSAQSAAAPAASAASPRAEVAASDPQWPLSSLGPPHVSRAVSATASPPQASPQQQQSPTQPQPSQVAVFGAEIDAAIAAMPDGELPTIGAATRADPAAPKRAGERSAATSLRASLLLNALPVRAESAMLCQVAVAPPDEPGGPRRARK